MSIKKPVEKRASGAYPVFISTWEELTKDDVGIPTDVCGARERTVQIEGDLAGCTVVIEGSNDDVNFRPLTNMDGIILCIRTPELTSVREFVKSIRPRIQDGDINTKVTVSLLIAAGR